jgi:hypothetical protein
MGLCRLCQWRRRWGGMTLLVSSILSQSSSPTGSHRCHCCPQPSSPRGHGLQIATMTKKMWDAHPWGRDLRLLLACVDISFRSCSSLVGRNEWVQHTICVLASSYSCYAYICRESLNLWITILAYKIWFFLQNQWTGLSLRAFTRDG